MTNLTWTERLIVAAKGNPSLVISILELALLEAQLLPLLARAARLGSTLSTAPANLRPAVAGELPAALMSRWRDITSRAFGSDENAQALACRLVGQAGDIARAVGGATGMRVYVSPPPFLFATFVPMEALIARLRKTSTESTTIRLPGGVRGLIRIQIRARKDQIDGHAFDRHYERKWRRQIRQLRGRVVDCRHVIVGGVAGLEAHAAIRSPPLLGPIAHEKRVAVLALRRAVCEITLNLPLQGDRRLVEAFEWVCRTFTTVPVGSLGSESPERGRAVRLTNEAYVAVEQGEWKEAKKKLLESLRLWEEAPDTHNELGYVYEHESDYARAEQHVRRALQLQPSSAKFHVSLAVCLCRQGRLPEARSAVKTALRLDPGYRSAQEMMAYLVRNPNG